MLAFSYINQVLSLIKNTKNTWRIVHISDTFVT